MFPALSSRVVFSSPAESGCLRGIAGEQSGTEVVVETRGVELLPVASELNVAHGLAVARVRAHAPALVVHLREESLSREELKATLESTLNSESFASQSRH